MSEYRIESFNRFSHLQAQKVTVFVSYKLSL